MRYDAPVDVAAHSTEASPTVLPPGIRGRYQLAETTMTLREGLAEYYEVNPGLSDPATLRDPASATYFHNHDCTHVVFGTHTAPLHEGVNDFWTIFGVDIRLRDYVGGFFATTESKKIAKSFGTWDTIVQTLRSLRLVFDIRRRAKAMHQKWPWTPPNALLDRPLVEIRRSYGIAVFRPEVALGLEPADAAVPGSDPA